MADIDFRNLGSSLEAQFRNLGDRHPGQWPLIPRLLCGVGVFFAVLAGGWYFYWAGEMELQARGEEEEKTLRAALSNQD